MSGPALLSRVMFRVGGFVMNTDMLHLDPQEFRGFVLADALAPLVFINGADSKAAQMFTLAHELAHLWLGQTALSDAAMVETSNHAIETWCNRVAAELLVPQTEFRAALQRDEALDLALQRWTWAGWTGMRSGAPIAPRRHA